MNNRSKTNEKRSSDDIDESVPLKHTLGRRSKRLIFGIILCILIGIMLLASISFYFTYYGKYPYLAPGIDLSTDSIISNNLTLAINKISNIDHESTDLSFFEISTIINGTNSSGLIHVPLKELVNNYSKGVIFLDELPLGHLNVGDKIILDRSIYDEGSIVNIFSSFTGDQILGHYLVH